MKPKTEEDFLKVLSVVGTRRILEFLDEHDKAQYITDSQFSQPIFSEKIHVVTDRGFNRALYRT